MYTVGQMKNFLTLPFFILALCAFSVAQEIPTNCPAISVNGPAGLVNVGELATYTARVGDGNQHYSVDYFWTTSAGRIKDGQGTASIRVIQPKAALAVTVEVRGLPPDCPAAATEQAIYDPPPLAEKFYELGDGESVQRLNVNLIRRTLGENPNNQLYILAGDVGGTNTDEFRTKESAILSMLVQEGVPRDRITIASVYADVEMFQFWRVPPGAVNPRCVECEDAEKQAKACPEISVTGPAGITLPGDTMTFVANITGDIPQGLRYFWSVSDGEIVKGQGTLQLLVRFRPRAIGSNATATIHIAGLPVGCPETFIERSGMTIDPGPERLGAIRNAGYTISKQLIRKIGAALRQNPNSQLYVWVYSNLPATDFSRLRSRLVRQLSATNIDPRRFSIARTSAPEPKAVFWLIRPGVENPAP
jgi:hypothetical protein